jgi:hypothetical protein
LQQQSWAYRDQTKNASRYRPEGCSRQKFTPLEGKANLYVVANSILGTMREAGSNHFIEVSGDSSLRSGDVGLDQIQDEAKGKQMVQDTQRAESLF